MKLATIFIIVIFSLTSQGELIDPTMPPWIKKQKIKLDVPVKVKKKSKESFYLTQIVRKPTGNRAVINGYVLKVGEHIHQARIVKIEPNRVLLVRGSEKWILKLEEKTSNVRQ